MVTILDYGMGNLRSVEKALQLIGMDTITTNCPKLLSRAKAIIIPGVGAFYDAMENLNQKGFTEILKKHAAEGKAILGICLGMQLLFERGYEIEEVAGLSLLQGEVVKIPPSVKVPHMGWNTLQIKDRGKLLEGITQEECVYFVHSYYIKEAAEEVIKGETSYGIRIPAAVEKNKIFGLQFHPEKSGEVGLRILNNFRRGIE
ncbi:imidazole glycerol phosphate synthase subunit HisH [Alkaliphilus serpentinus]|uniref:Imidazole glycerol phosphate synthase subunit HisH n=1 Tax=Alkaliphilus serpentinus TaxID=1482731 RepID=A0A833HR05_9FIRM|nr:imidazole glycerol phosphate synthase subunit HisH [Alkaliphilus serpentinus]KAB3532719.1 imidazole glycerol phosphate synthase subunit HisH [Alkaliphilus serpentinus]